MTLRASLILGIAILILAGCATLPTAQEAKITRYAAAPVPGVQAALATVAAERGFTAVAPDHYRKPVAYPHDPIFGIVKTSDTPSQYLQLAFVLTPGNGGTLIAGVVSTYSPKPKAGASDTFYWRPGTAAHAEAVELIESAIATAAAK